jgi:DNA-binding CsgD family transcriptional regulator
MVLFGGSARGWTAMSARQTQALLSLIEQDWDLFADTAAHQWMGWSAGEAGRAVADGIRAAVTPQIARATMQAASAADVTELLPRVAARTLVLHPREMAQIPVDVAQSLAMALPRGRLVLLEGAQPVLFTEHPDEIVSLLTGFFLDGVEPAETPSAVVAGRPVPPSDGLSPRELEVLRLLAAGESNAQIARRLGLSTHTVERHVANLYRKIGARGRADAVNGLRPAPRPGLTPCWPAPGGFPSVPPAQFRGSLAASAGPTVASVPIKDTGGRRWRKAIRGPRVSVTGRSGCPGPPSPS